MTDGLPLPRRYLAIAAMSFGSALVIIDGGVANVALPTIARDLHVDQSAVVSVVTIYQVMLVMLMLPFAGLGERVGLKRIYQGGQLVFTVATLLCFFAKSLPFLLIVRAVQAIGAAGVLSVASALIRQIYPANQLGRGLGINSVVVTSAAAAAPTIGGLVLSVAPWPWVFASAIPFAVASLALGSAIPAPKPRAATFDVIGAVMCAAMFGLIIGGLETMVHGDSPVVSAAIVLLGIVIGYYFVRREKGEPDPILPIDLLARPVLALSAVGGFLAFTASMTLLISTPFRLHALGFSAAAIGAAIAPWPLTNMVVARRSQAFSRIAFRRESSVGSEWWCRSARCCCLRLCPPIRAISTSRGEWRCADRGSAPSCRPMRAWWSARRRASALRRRAGSSRPCGSPGRPPAPPWSHCCSRSVSAKGSYRRSSRSGSPRSRDCAAWRAYGHRSAIRRRPKLPTKCRR
ncbi:MFS family permease [Sphingomonas sp. UYP23]